jgi:hypothetical protein
VGGNITVLVAVGEDLLEAARRLVITMLTSNVIKLVRVMSLKVVLEPYNTVQVGFTRCVKLMSNEYPLAIIAIEDSSKSRLLGSISTLRERGIEVFGSKLVLRHPKAND